MILKKEIDKDAYYRAGTCYNCKGKLTNVHFFYNDMCQKCGDLNYNKRNQTCNLTGYKALVTGGRIKIGFETVLKLLRSGADVILTSRFPNDAYLRYSKVDDFGNWKNRLRIFGIDLRHIHSVESFIDILLKENNPIDIIINNAAQTVRRPSIYYRHLLENEQKSLDNIDSLQQPTHNQVVDIISSSSTLNKLNGNFFPYKKSIKSTSNNLSFSAALTQIPLLPEDNIFDNTLFPFEKYDKDGQQEDRRDFNSWMYELEDVHLIEFYEVLNVNLITPFLLNTRLKSLLNANSLPSFIVNVTAMEGNFAASRKRSRHPHTNMAKAALNMMTRTSAQHYANDHIYMNSVDTGWITNEKPFPIDVKESDRKIKMAIDEVDGASRILDPIFNSINNNMFNYGKLYRNYREFSW